MYWYLSFLRPPPVSVSDSSEGVVITPQVANDLRTEVRYESTEIFYQWQQVSPTTTSSNGKAVHLTTFLPPGSTYQSLEIPLPRIRAGEKWRLALWPDSLTHERQRLDTVMGESSKVPVIGVWSEPILITAATQDKRETKKQKIDIKAAAKGKGKERERDDGPKQTRIQREWDFPPKADESGNVLRIIEQTSYDLDKKIWDSGLALSAWLAERFDPEEPSEPTHNMEQRILALLKDGKAGVTRRVLELGKLAFRSGTGLVSIVLRSCLSTATLSCNTEITATDLESAMELMRENIALNAPRQDRDSRETDDDDVASTRFSLSERTLDWDEPLPQWVTSDHPDLIIAADVTYNTASFPSLIKTLSNLMQPSSGQRPPLLLAYKQRDEAERELWNMLEKENTHLELIDTIAGAEPDGQVEIWAGQYGDA